MTAHERYYNNNLEENSSALGPLIDGSTKLTGRAYAEIEATFKRLFLILESNVSSERDSSVYTGLAGYAYLYFALSEASQNVQTRKKAIHLVEKSLKVLRMRDISFLCGDAGPLAIGAAIYCKDGNAESAWACVKQLRELASHVTMSAADSCYDELLYGRVGLLYALLFTRKYIPESINDSEIKQVVDIIMQSGNTNSEPPLMWAWHKKKYLGGAHGVAGILYLLLQVKALLDGAQLEKIRRTVDYLLGIRFPDGNFPSSLGSKDNRLVHWCHGAPGVVQLLLLSYDTWRDIKYLKAAEQCGNVVWERGLLRKGYGICHGVAGNAYTFLALYQVTRREVHLHRAVQFAIWCSSYNSKQDCEPDRPYSLFEGLAGTLYFLNDIMSPLEATFPCYSIEPFQFIPESNSVIQK